jgi:glycosyltransferase involved in cell wall biosynthesis
MSHQRRAVIIVENMPVPADRHVWQMALALRDADWEVIVICPSTADHPEHYLTLEGVEIRRHWLPAEGQGIAGLVREYAVALFQQTRLLAYLRLKGRIDVIHFCNPPDLMFLVALPYRLLGTRLVYDVHDLNPELFESRFGNRSLLLAAVRLAERLSVAVSQRILVSNESFRERILSRTRARPEQVETCYTIPQTGFLGPPKVLDAPRQPIVLGYIGIMGFQDGLDHLVDAVADLKRTLGQSHVRALVVGDGPALPMARARAEGLGLTLEDIEFTGFQTGAALRALAQQFDIGIIPDPPSLFNDIIPMNKVFEYSALGIPSVSYRLQETQRLLGDAGTYAEGDTPNDLARALLRLVSSPDLHFEKSKASLDLARQRFCWDREAGKLLATYEALAPRHGTSSS